MDVPLQTKGMEYSIDISHLCHKRDLNDQTLACKEPEQRYNAQQLKLRRLFEIMGVHACLINVLSFFY